MIKKRIALIFSEKGTRQVAGSLKTLSSDLGRTRRGVAAVSKVSGNIAAFKGLKRELAAVKQAQKLAAQQARVLGSAQASAAQKASAAKAKYHGLRTEVASAKSAYANAAKAAKKAGAGSKEAAAKVAAAKLVWEQKKQKLAEAKAAYNAASAAAKKSATGVAAATAKAKAAQGVWRQKAVRLREVSAELKKAGVNTKKLAEHERKLAAQVKKTNALMAARSKARAGREAGRQMRQSAMGDVPGLLAAGAPLIGASKMAIDLESSMADVKKVVDFSKYQGGIAAFQQRLVDLGAGKERIPLKPKQLAEIAAAGGQLGIAAKKLEPFVLTTSKMAVAWDMAAGEAGEASAKISNILSIPIEKMGLLGDAINHLSDNTAAKGSELINFMKRSAASGKAFGLLPTQTLALGDAMIALGKPPEVAARGINYMLAALQTAPDKGKKFQEALKQIGWDAYELKFSIESDAQGTLLEFLESIASLDKGEQTSILAKLFGTEWSDDLTSLLSGLDQYKKALRLVGAENNYAGSMQKEFMNRASTTANKGIILLNKFNREVLGFGGGLLPAINQGIDAAGAFLDRIAAIRKEFPALTAAVQKAAGIMLGAVVAWKALKIGGKLIGGTGKEMWNTGRGVLARVGLAKKGKGGKAGKLGGIAGALASADAQPVFVTNWPGGYGSADGYDAPGGERGKEKGKAGKAGGKAKRPSRIRAAASRGRSFAGRVASRGRGLAGGIFRGAAAGFRSLARPGTLLGLGAAGLATAAGRAEAAPALAAKAAAPAAAPKSVAKTPKPAATPTPPKPAAKPAPAKVLPFERPPLVKKEPVPPSKPAAEIPKRAPAPAPVKPAASIRPAAPKTTPKMMARAALKAEQAAAKTAATIAKKTGLSAAKATAKTVAKSFSKTALKKIPLLGLLAGGVFGAQRAMAGDFTGAALELLSGAAGALPGLGTAASLGLDAAIMTRDIARQNVPQEQGQKPAGPGIAALMAPLVAVSKLGGVMWDGAKKIKNVAMAKLDALLAGAPKKEPATTPVGGGAPAAAAQHGLKTGSRAGAGGSPPLFMAAARGQADELLRLARHTGGQAGGQNMISYSPTINAPGGNSSEIKSLLKEDRIQFERFIERTLQGIYSRQQRRSLASAGG